MGRSCAVSGCGNLKGDCSKKNRLATVSLHRFPLKSHLLKDFENFVDRKGFRATPSSRICSDHFRPDDMIYRHCGKRELKTGVVPTADNTTGPTIEKRSGQHFQSDQVNFPNTSSAAQTIAQEALVYDQMVLPSTSIATQRLTSEHHKSVQTEITLHDLIGLENKKLMLEDELVKLVRHKICNFSIHCLTERSVNDLIGFDKKTFMTVFNFLNLELELASKTKESLLSAEDKLFLTILKIRQALTDRVLSVVFMISVSTVNNIIRKCIEIMYWKSKSVNIWPSKDLVRAYMPQTFYERFPSCRLIIDATEFFIQKPGNPSQQQASFSSYKNDNTLKALIGIAPSGAISFISDLWLGCISDQELTRRSGLIDLLESGDTVLADRGFAALKPEFEERGITLLTPSFLRDKVQFEVKERGENKQISSHRCHIERAIGKIKRFKILSTQMNIQMKYFEQIYYVCAFLTNFYEPLISCASKKG